MIKARKLPDGRYNLTFDSWSEERSVFERSLLGDRPAVLRNASWICKADTLSELGAEKIYGVVTGPSSCGCEPAGFRWVTEPEVEAGKTFLRSCRACGSIGYYPDHQCDIIDVCGEADVAKAVFEAEFAGKLAAIT